MRIILFLLLINLSTSFVEACPIENGGATEGLALGLNIGVNDIDNFLKRSSDQMTEEKFNYIIDQIASVYRPVIKKLGGKLKVNKDWSDGTVNAYAQQFGKSWEINLFGGYARHKEQTPDSFAIVVCHEIGHHIAGYPIYTRGWASSEGQSDYFAAAKCFKAAFGHEDSSVHAADFIFDVDGLVSEKCSQAHQFGNDADYFMCLRLAKAAQARGNVYADLRREAQPSVKTPSREVVKKHFNRHPATQCRVDTAFQGALCNESLDLLHGTSDYKEGYCTRAEGYEMGVRPKCWFNPEQAERESFSAWF